ncbi:hypothetical protein EI555_008615 [Monodon monoceros]|uniref:Uncharacterized protein n=1 Tax=Monodon monoceros TaxID=40151 RepID=A0A4U1EDL3_MONMO|nr:hypothetical protein EI555_008615 [Monodon monoceros]
MPLQRIQCYKNTSSTCSYKNHLILKLNGGRKACVSQTKSGCVKCTYWLYYSRVEDEGRETHWKLMLGTGAIVLEYPGLMSQALPDTQMGPDPFLLWVGTDVLGQFGSEAVDEGPIIL